MTIITTAAIMVITLGSGYFAVKSIDDMIDNH